MLGSEAIAQIQQGLGWRSDKSVEILAALRFAQLERERPGRTLPDFLIATDQTLSVLTGIPEVTLPTDFITERSFKEGNLRYKTSATARTWWLQKKDMEEADSFFFGTWTDVRDTDSVSNFDNLSPGLPRAYILRDTTIRLYPTPDANYSLTWDFYKNADQIIAEEENVWLAKEPWTLIADAGLKLAMDLRDAKGIENFTGLRNEFSAAFYRNTIARRLNGRSYSIGRRL